MLENRGMSAYALHVKSLETDEKGKKKYRLHQSVISKIKNNKSKALQLDILSVLCELLDCQPADLMTYESTTQSASTTQNVNTTQSATDGENEFTMTTAGAGKVLGLHTRTVCEYAAKGLLKGKQGKQDHWFFRQSDVLEFKAQRDKE